MNVTGTNVGFGDDNCWGYENSQAYRADVTGLITGNGPYLIDNLIKDGGDININGVSLLVFYHDADPDNNVASYIVFEGNDSNVASIYGPGGWGSLWDIKTFNVAPLVTGLNTLRVTSPIYNGDCLSLVAAAVIVGGPQPATSVAFVAPSQLSAAATPAGSNGGRQ